MVNGELAFLSHYGSVSSCANRATSCARVIVSVSASPVTLTGRQLAVHGLSLPVLNPESVMLIHAVAVG